MIDVKPFNNQINLNIQTRRESQIHFQKSDLIFKNARSSIEFLWNSVTNSRIQTNFADLSLSFLSLINSQLGELKSISHRAQALNYNKNGGACILSFFMVWHFPISFVSASYETVGKIPKDKIIFILSSNILNTLYPPSFRKDKKASIITSGLRGGHLQILWWVKRRDIYFFNF